MKFLPIVLVLVSVSVYAEQQCAFDETAYTDFVKKYNAEHASSRVGPDGRTLIVSRGKEEIIIHGGGCVHLGVSIELISQKEYTRATFLHKVLDLATEFGDWLINTEKLKDSITNGKYQKINDVYFFDVDAMTVFCAERRDQGGILVDFYIN